MGVQPALYAARTRDGKLVLTSCMDGPPQLWDAMSGEKIRKFEGHTGVILSAAFSPDGKQAIGAGWADETAPMWDVASGKTIRLLAANAGPVSPVAFSHDGKRVATGNYGGATIVWDSATGERLCDLVGFTNGDWAVVDPQGHYDASNPDKLDGLCCVVGNKPVDLAQFKQQLYEPGLLAKKMGLDTTPYRAAGASKN